MEIIIGGKRSGKTKKMIEMCHDIGGYIVCCSEAEAGRVFDMANKMKMPIPFPISIGYAKGLKDGKEGK